MTQQVGARDMREMLRREPKLTQLLQALFPQHTITYPVFTPLNPTRPDKTPGSFVIWTQGAAAGGFNEYATGYLASGDVLDLIAYVRGADRRYAFAFARDFLGIRVMTAQELAREKQQARTAAAVTVAQQSETQKRKIARANDIWSKTVPLAGSVAEIYLASRRIPYVTIRHREQDLRFAPRLEWWKGARWDKSSGDLRKVEDGPMLPAMVAAVRNLAGDLTAVHCTFLRADGSGKADVAEPKLMRGLAKGSATFLTRGASDLPVHEAIGAGVIEPFVVCEGIEKGLALALALPEARVASAGSFDLMMALDVRNAAFDPVIYGADNDGRPEADDQLADRVEEIKALGKHARVMKPQGVKDWDDLLD